MVRGFIFFLLMSLLSSCGALKRTKRIDRVKESVEVNVNSSTVSVDKTKEVDRSVKKEKVSENRSNEVTEEKQTFFDEKGNVFYVVERKTIRGNEVVDRDTRDSSDIIREGDKKSVVEVEAEFRSKVDSLKKDSSVDRTENSVWSWIGGGILIVFVAVAVVIFVRFRK